MGIFECKLSMNNCLKLGILVLMFVTFSQVCVNAQETLQEFKKKIKNSDLQFEVEKRGETRILDSHRIILQKMHVEATSMNVNKMISRYGRDSVLQMLQFLLKDTTADWYANILLYDITDREASRFIVADTREEWLEAYRNLDMAYWEGYFERMNEKESK